MRKIVIFICLLLVTYGIFAEIKPSADQIDPSVKSAKPSNSKEVREHRRFLIYSTPVGLDLSTLATTPVSAGSFITPNFLLEIHYGACLVCMVSLTGSGFDIQTFGLGFRYFFGNSFNVMVNVHAITAFNTYDRTHFLTLFRIGIGNQWFFNNGISIGADWVDVNLPLYFLPGWKGWDDIVSYFLVAGGLLNFHIGYAF